MPIEENRLTNHDLLIRVDADVKHLNDDVRNVQSRMTEHERNTAALTDNLNRLTYNVGALVEGMKDAKEAMNKLGNHEQRLKRLEEADLQCIADREEVNKKVEEHEKALDRSKFLWKIVWTVVGSPVAIGMLYIILKVMNSVADKV